MEKRLFGTTGLSIAPLIFGGNVFGWTADEKRSLQLLDLFFDNGFNCIDTADSYSVWVAGHAGGESETIIGKWLKQRGRRAEVVLATKVGWEIPPDKKGLSKNYIMAEVETSLKRLQTDYIDLYQSHKDDMNTPPEETLEAYEMLIRQGKVRYIGASNFSRERLEQSLQTSSEKGLPAYCSIQPEFNLYERSFEKDFGDLVKKHHLAVIPYRGLASGFLTGKYRSEKDFSKSTRGKGMAKYLNKKGFAILDALDKLAATHQCSPAAIALAWLIQHPLITAPIASATSEEQLSEIMKAAHIRLSNDEMEMLNEAGQAPA